MADPGIFIKTATGVTSVASIPGPAGPPGPSGQTAGRIFYLTSSVASDIAGYKAMLEAPSAGAEQTFVTPCTAASGDTLVATFATAVGVPGVLDFPAGTGYRDIYAMVSAGTARFRLQVFKRTAAGVETLARDEISADFNNQVVLAQHWVASAPSGGAMAIDDRIVVKLYAARVIGPTTVTVTTFVEGTAHTSQIQTTISAGAQGPAGPAGAPGTPGVDAAEGLSWMGGM